MATAHHWRLRPTGSQHFGLNGALLSFREIFLVCDERSFHPVLDLDSAEGKLFLKLVLLFVTALQSFMLGQQHSPFPHLP